MTMARAGESPPSQYSITRPSGNATPASWPGSRHETEAYVQPDAPDCGHFGRRAIRQADETRSRLTQTHETPR